MPPQNARQKAAIAADKAKSKETMKITKFARFNIPNKKTKIQKEDHDYFTATDAIETLLKSKHCVTDGEKVPRADRKPGKLYTRDDVLVFFKYVVGNRFAIRCAKKFKDDKKPDESKKEESKMSQNEDTDTEKKEKKRKFKILVHPSQGFFDDPEEVYIWRYNPTPLKHWFYGCLVLLVVIGGTLFPLWPDTLRTGVYYTSISLAGFIGSILVIGLLRTILFGIIWAVTGGKHNLWILPNLLEDVGFFESFQPVYTYDIKGQEKPKKKKKKEVEDNTDGNDSGSREAGSGDEEAKKDK